jgi:hypothetical protein
MPLLRTLRKRIANFGTNIKLGLQAERLLIRNENYLKEGDSVPIHKTRRLIRQSTMPKERKGHYDAELSILFGRHLDAGANWLEFREMLIERQKSEKRRFSKKEMDQMWKKWNKNREGY